MRRGEQLPLGATSLSRTLPVPDTACSSEHRRRCSPPAPFTIPDPLQLGVTPHVHWPTSAPASVGRSRPGHSLIPVFLRDLVEGPKHSRQHSVTVVLNEAQDILVVPEIQSPLCNLGASRGRSGHLVMASLCVPGPGIHPHLKIPGALPSTLPILSSSDPLKEAMR